MRDIVVGLELFPANHSSAAEPNWSRTMDYKKKILFFYGNVESAFYNVEKNVIIIHNLPVRAGDGADVSG